MVTKARLIVFMVAIFGPTTMLVTAAGNQAYGAKSATIVSATSLPQTVYLPLIVNSCFPYSVPSPTPSYFWYTCFNSLDEVQNPHLNRQGRYSLIADPTGSGRGTILKTEVAPDLAYFDPQYLPNGKTVVRSYPTMYIPNKNGPHLIGVDIYLEDDFSPAIASTNDGPALCILSEFYETGTSWRYTFCVSFGQPENGNYYLGLGTPWGWADRLPNALSFTFKQWHRIEVLFTADRKMYLIQDGQTHSLTSIPPEIPLTTAGGHPGLYGLSADGSHKPPFTTGTLYHDNWSMIVWP